MMVFRKSIPRRTFLRGAGTALALPLLDAMFPAFASAAQTASSTATRLSFLAVPNGIIMDKWTPAAIGREYPITPVLEPLAGFKGKLNVLNGLFNREGDGGHARCTGNILSGSRLQRGRTIKGGVSRHFSGPDRR